jgi:hypothetical protein
MTGRARDKQDLSRRKILKGAAATGAGVLPLALALPSNAHNVITSDAARRAAMERELRYRLGLRAELERQAASKQLAQVPRMPPGTMPRPLPPAPPSHATINTEYSTSVSTQSHTDTFSAKPGKSEQADDVNHQTYSDGSKSDYKSDQA